MKASSIAVGGMFDDFGWTNINNPVWDCHFWQWNGSQWIELSAERFTGGDRAEMDAGVAQRRPALPSRYGHGWFYVGWYERDVFKHGEMWSA